MDHSALAAPGLHLSPHGSPRTTAPFMSWMHPLELQQRFGPGDPVNFTDRVGPLPDALGTSQEVLNYITRVAWSPSLSLGN